MALLYINEYGRLATEGAGQSVMAGVEPSRAQTPVSIGAGSLQSAAFATNFVRIHTDSVCFLVFGANPTAVAQQGVRLAANQTEFFGVVPGHVVAVIGGV